MRYEQNRAPLAPLQLLPLPLGSIRPEGWLLSQLRIQADGRTGRLGDLWPDVGSNSAWLGGTGEDWERGPYYLDGLLPIAHLLDDEELLAKVRPWVEWTLNSQGEDGQFGPRTNDDWWPRMVMLKVLIMHHEATGDDRVIPFLDRYFRFQDREIRSRKLFRWAAARGAENMTSIFWLYNQTGESYLLELAHEIHRQSIDWTTIFEVFPHRTYQPRDTVGMTNHVVNNAMAVKHPSLYSLLSGEARHREGSGLAIRNLMHFHGLAQGMYSGDELLAGPHPSQGVETCAVVEFMYSLEHLVRIHGDVAYGDLLEKIAYNALPAAFTDDMYGQQYDQQPNQVLCTLEKRNWTNNTDAANLFGMEPNFGCCTANYHQGWPKLTMSLWAATPDGGLAAVAYAPCSVTAQVAGGAQVQLRVETEYPFRETVRVTVGAAAATRFPMLLRIPSWCTEAAVYVNGAPVGAAPAAGTFCRIDRTWLPGDVVELRLPMTVRLQDRPTNGAIAVERGPLVFSLAVGAEWRRLRGEDPSPDWEVYPTTPWNYGLLVDRGAAPSAFTVQEGAIGPVPFSASQPPVTLIATGRQIPGWELERNSAGTPPPSPVAVDSPNTQLTLVPYGAAKLRITEFPVVAG